MNIALVDGDAVLQVGDYRTIFPNTSFGPSGPDDAFLAENNAMRINVFIPHDSNTEKLVSCDPYIEGDWVYTVEVEDLTAEEIDARLESQWVKVRTQRNELLAKCDWTQLTDSPADKQEWSSYRQELRDITEQTDPFAINWPTDPDYVEPEGPEGVLA